ncbi:MAG TPA: EamA family transporter [Spirochaetia bacterium]|nr:EamA family transporter [Spirochaetia bacterium]
MVETERMKGRPLLVVACYITIYIVWGSTYFFIRRSVATIPPGWVLAIRWITGGVLLLGFAAARGRVSRLPSPRELAASIVLGVLLLLVGNGGITVAEKYIDSYIAALLASSTPIVVAVFDAALLGKPLSVGRILGVVLGFGGVALLLYNGHSVAGSISPAVLIGLLGAVSWGLATSLGHRAPVHGDNTVNSGIQMLFVGIVSLIGSLVFGPSPAAVISSMSAASLVGVLYLGIIGSLAFSAYTYLVSCEPAERLVSYALVNPLIAVLLGLGLGGESPTPLLGVGFPLILVGLAFMIYGERVLGWLRSLAARK